MQISRLEPERAPFIRAVLRLLRMKVRRALRRQPLWVSWNRHVGREISGYEVNQRLRLSFPVNVLTAAQRMGVDVAFHKDCAWDAAIESDRFGNATIYVDVGSSLEHQRYLVALALGYLLHTVPTIVVRLRLNEEGRAHRAPEDDAGRRALIFALQLMLPLNDVRKRFGAHWLASHARVPLWFAQQGIDGPGWVLLQE